MKKKINGRLIGIIIGIVATIGLLGPYVFEFLFELAAAHVASNVQLTLAIIFVVVNGIALFLGKKVWRLVAFIMSIVLVGLIFAPVFHGWMVVLTEQLWLKIVAIVALIVSVVVSYIIYKIDTKPAAK